MKPETNRVLSRTGARELTSEELARISGGANPATTGTITFNPIDHRAIDVLNEVATPPGL
jgi:hypothetical protein